MARPYLFSKLRAGDASEQIGASLGLAEVFVRMEKARMGQAEGRDGREGRENVSKYTPGRAQIEKKEKTPSKCGSHCAGLRPNSRSSFRKCRRLVQRLKGAFSQADDLDLRAPTTTSWLCDEGSWSSWTQCRRCRAPPPSSNFCLSQKQAMKMDFVPFIERLFPAMLMGVTGEKDRDGVVRLAASIWQYASQTEGIAEDITDDPALKAFFRFRQGQGTC